MNKDRILQTVKKDVRSLLIASKLGLSVQGLEHDYRAMIGSSLPLRSLAYRSTMELLVDIPDVVNIHTNVDGTITLSAVVNEETKTMAELVSKQKISCKKRGIYRRRIIRPVTHMDLVRRGRVAPVLPISVKSELRDLLSISPLLVSQLESSFYKRFGRSFQYTRYGFYSLIEVLQSVSDFVQIQQTRAGSLLVLKTPVPSRTLNCPNLQYAKPDNLLKGTSSVPVNGDQSSSTKSHVTDSPLPPTVPQSSGLTLLDKLFMTAKAEYFANNPSKIPGAVKQSSETTCSHRNTEISHLEKGLTSSFLPSATVKGTVEKPVITPITHIEAVTTDRPSLDTRPIKTDVAEPVTGSTLQGLEEKFEKDLKFCLSQTRGSFVVGDDLRQDIKHVVKRYPEGLPLSHLLAAFKQHIGKDLPYQQMGFMSVLDLVGKLGDLLYLDGSRERQDWRLFDIDSKSAKNVNTDRIDEKDLGADDISKWNSLTQKSEWLKSPGPITPTDGMSLWRVMDEPLLVSEKDVIPLDAVRKKKLCRLPYMKRSFMIGVYVENVTSPSDFYIRGYSKDTSQKLEDMLMDMRFCYSDEYTSSRYIVPDEYVTVGEIYALSVNGDVWWYRVIIHAVISSKEVQVFYPDFGTLATVRRCWLRFLKSCFMTLPAQAVPSTLPCLKPVQDQWSVEAIKVFQNLCARGPLVGVVLQYVLDQLCLFLCDTSTDEDLYLHQVLIDKGLASMVAEPGTQKKRNPFMQYLIQASEQPQEVPQDTPDEREHDTTEVLEVQPQEPASQIRVKEDPALELPCLEAFPDGEDVWDENCFFSGRTASFKCASKLPSNNAGEDQEKPKLEETNGCHGEASSEPPEQFYISLIESRNAWEDTTVLQSPPKRCDEFEQTDQPNANLQDNPLCVTPEEEKPQSLEYNCLFNESSSINQAAGAANPLMGFQKFQIPRSSATFALGPAARLAATPGSFLNWFA